MKFDKEHEITYEGVVGYKVKLKMLGVTTTIEGIDKTASAYAKIGGKSIKSLFVVFCISHYTVCKVGVNGCFWRNDQ